MIAAAGLWEHSDPAHALGMPSLGGMTTSQSTPHTEQKALFFFIIVLSWPLATFRGISSYVLTHLIASSAQSSDPSEARTAKGVVVPLVRFKVAPINTIYFRQSYFHKHPLHHLWFPLDKSANLWNSYHTQALPHLPRNGQHDHKLLTKSRFLNIHNCEIASKSDIKAN